MFDSVLEALEGELRAFVTAILNAAITGLISTARSRLEGAVTDVAKERARGFAEAAEACAKGFAER
jgi:hypothetical protein